MRKPCCFDQIRGACSKEEAEKKKMKMKNTQYIKKQGFHRCEKSCRVKWVNYHQRAEEVKVKGDNFGEDEEDLFIKLHALLGNRWSLIAGRLPGRTEKEVKKYWNSHLKRKLISMGIDPDNHHPRGPHGPAPGFTYGSTTTSTTTTHAHAHAHAHNNKPIKIYVSDAESSVAA